MSLFKIILDQDHFCSMFFHSATVAELFLTIERTTYTIRRVRDTASEPLAAPSLKELAVLFLKRPAGFESDRFLFLPKFPSRTSDRFLLLTRTHIRARTRPSGVGGVRGQARDRVA